MRSLFRPEWGRAQNAPKRGAMGSDKYNGALVTTHAETEVLCANVCGFIGASVAQAIVRDSVLWSPGRPVLAQIVNYSKALLQIDQQSLFDSVSRGLAGGRPTPTAIISPPDCLEVFEAYSKLCAQAGIPKQVFTTFEDAQRWAGRQAAVRADWIEHHHRISLLRSASSTTLAENLAPRLSHEVAHRRTLPKTKPQG